MRSRLLLLFAVCAFALAAPAAHADQWVSPGQTIQVTGWSYPIGTGIARVNFSNITGPGVAYRVTVVKDGWTSGWPWAYWSWSAVASPMSYAPGTVAADFTTYPGRDYHLELRGMEGVGRWTCHVTLTRLLYATTGLPAGAASAETPRTWGALKNHYR